MDILHMQRFKIIAESENVSSAAEKLFISQPALSRSLAEFEKELGCTLFDRTKNSITLNARGTVALEHVNRILHDIASFQAEMETFRGEWNMLRILATAQVFLAFAIKRLLHEKGMQQLSATSTDQRTGEASLRSGSADLLFSYVPVLQGDSFVCRKFCTETIAVSMPKSCALARKAHVFFGDLDHREVLHGSQASWGDFSNLVIQRQTQAGITTHSALMLSEPIMLGLKEELDVLYYTSSFCEERMQPERFSGSNRVVRLLEDDAARIPIYLTYPVKKAGTVEPFLAWLAQAILELPQRS